MTNIKKFRSRLRKRGFFPKISAEKTLVFIVVARDIFKYWDEVKAINEAVNEISSSLRINPPDYEIVRAKVC